MLVNLTDDEIKVIYRILEANYCPYEVADLDAFNKISKVKDIIENPCRNLCKSFGDKKMADRYIDAQKTTAYFGSEDLNDFIKANSGNNEVLTVDNNFVVTGIQEMYEGDHRFFNLLVEGQ